MSKSKSNKIGRKVTKMKHIIKFLSDSPANKITKTILATCFERVIYAISNAVFNVQQNPDVKLDKVTCNLFSTNLRSYNIITYRQISVENKRKHLTQYSGALLFIGLLFGSALLSSNSGFISRMFNRGVNN